MIETTVLTESGKKLYRSCLHDEKVFVVQKRIPTCDECVHFVQHYSKADIHTIPQCVTYGFQKLAVGHCIVRRAKSISRSAAACEMFLAQS